MSETTQTNEASGFSSELERLLAGTITQQQAEEIFAMGKEAVICALLNLYARCMAANNANAQGQPSPSTPSSTAPPYLKERKKQKGKRGRPVNHKGEHRKVPEPDKNVSLHLDQCPECGGPLSECRAKSTRRQRIVEDIPEGIKAETTRYDMATYWCPHCKKTFTPKVPDALPGHTIGKGNLLFHCAEPGTAGSTRIFQGILRRRIGYRFLGTLRTCRVYRYAKMPCAFVA